MKRTAYLAAPYSARPVAARLAGDLEQIGYTVVSSWHQGAPPPSDVVPTPDQLRDAAARCLTDLRRADVLVLLTWDVAGGLPLLGIDSGGRHVETGYALALAKDVHVVGGPENVFHHWTSGPRTRGGTLHVHADWHAACLALAAHQLQDALAQVQALEPS
jgi:hypothetical protein